MVKYACPFLQFMLKGVFMDLSVRLHDFPPRILFYKEVLILYIENVSDQNLNLTVCQP